MKALRLVAFLSLLLTLAPFAALAASSVPPTPKLVDGKVDTSIYKKAPPYVIGVSNVSVVNSFRVQMIGELKQAAASNPDVSKLIVTDAGGSATKQISDIEDLLAQGVDALLVAPASGTAINPAIEEAYKAGIPVIVFNSDVTTKQVVAKVLSPYHDWAQQTAEWLAKAMGGNGNVIALRGIAGLAAEANEWSGVQQAFKDYPGVKVIGSEYADWAYDKAKTAMLNLVANHPKVDGVASIGDGMTWAAAEVLKNRGYDVTNIPMIGIGGSNGFLKYWQRNHLDAYVIADPTTIGANALDVALKALSGEPVQPLVSPPTIVINNDNLDKYVKPSLPDSAWVGTNLSTEQLKSILGQ